MTDKINKVSSEAVKKATNKDWDKWLTLLDKAGAKKWSHKEIVAHLDKKYALQPWWQQMVSVGYEHARGKRLVGETLNTGFQIGVQKTVDLPQKKAWKVLTSKEGIAAIFGVREKFILKKGATFESEGGITGEIRVITSGEKIRLIWKLPKWEKSSILQIWLIENDSGKTSVRFHQENLPTLADRESMRMHWQEVMAKIFNSSTA